MMKYLQSKNLIGIGFCMPKSRVFYEKCGFIVNTISSHRFVAVKDGKRITNQDGQYVFYCPHDSFMERVLANPHYDVILPEPNLW